MHRDEYRCWYCGQPIRFNEATIDHQLPRCKGGTDLPDNLVAACKRCNSKKGTRTLDEFRQYRINELGFKEAIDALDKLLALDRFPEHRHRSFKENRRWLHSVARFHGEEERSRWDFRDVMLDLEHISHANHQP